MMMLRNLSLAFFLLFLFTCKETKTSDAAIMSAEDLVHKSIEMMGGKQIDNSEISFDFRDKHFKAIRDQGKFQLERQFKDSLVEIRDVLDNSGFARYEEGQKIKVVDSMIPKYSGSVNSVHYFSILPYGLDGKAVHKTYLDSVDIAGEQYHKIKVTFSEDGGGEDFEDEYIYWINSQTYTVDYLAYSYKEEDGSPGYRFRKAYNPRKINGVRFVDYENYKPMARNVELKKLDQMFMADQLELVSKIDLKNIEVERLN